MEEKLYTVQQAAGILQCSLSTIRRRIKSGELKAIKSGQILRIPESSIKAMMQPTTDTGDTKNGGGDQ
jgi:excisionase family DNA binding protein